MDTVCNHQIIGHRTTFWTFQETATADTFKKAFNDFYKVIHRPEIDRLLIELRMPDSFLGKEIQEILLETGKIAQQAGIVKWGLIADAAKLGALRYLVRGGVEGGRTYEFLISDSADEVVSWIDLPVPSAALQADSLSGGELCHS